MRALGIILAGGKNERLRELTYKRAVAAMPIAGSYRAIDFSLSNMMNSGISKVAVVTQYNSRSLIEHLSSSKWWDFGRKHGGLYVFTPYITRDSSLWYRGTADAIHQNLSYLKDSHEPYAIVAQGDAVCKIDFNRVLEYHVEKRADITIVCARMEQELHRYGMVEVDEDNRIVEFEEKPVDPKGDIVSTGIYIIRRRLLIELIEACAKEERYDFVSDVIIRYRKQKRIYAYLHDDYWSSIASLPSYYQVNMDFLKRENRDKFFREYPTIMTKVEDEPPAKFNQGSRLSNSLCSSGCIINGQVDDSVLFRKVFVGRNSVVRNSIIMDGAYIGENCIVENCIVDSKSRISDGSVYITSGQGDIRVVSQKEQYTG
ncbi:glucose-1-phosphate adenylyltransferase subunit GlgD [Anaerotalea alkaliphila]|uniref:Glucose-1-phosphate adenylyltransferase subunit GlgD n=1 Tax=Anaerotalea alkaliphila TaxID=2662126 RepID=A0A7X5KLE2_9FIRM|nr:glucose-1-phosphate adenylyltransferase subunit GlgD [Anaerotalea alkaliphila]NDL66736.1 glucose-1-phosphate adenylyltransferase subunit GlgD [Anaerotalea alkaliphila]